MKAVSTVIPNWNGAALLRKYLPSVLAASEAYPGESEVIVVDDASTDDSREVIEKEFSGVRLVVHERNQGFGGACWSGVQAARHPVVILLNSDVQPDPGFVRPLVERFDDDRTFSASPVIYDGSGEPDRVSIVIPHWRRGKIRYRRFPMDLLVRYGSLAPEPWYTLFPLGGACAVRRDRFVEMGGFDELYRPFYYEDLDLGFRAWRRGWTCEVVLESRVVHQGGGTIARSFGSFRLLAIRKRNRLLYQWKNLTSSRYLASHFFYQPIRVVHRALMLRAAAVVGAAWALPRLPEALARRREERAVALRSVEEILDVISTAAEINQKALERYALEEQERTAADG